MKAIIFETSEPVLMDQRWQAAPKPKPFPSFHDGDVEIRLSTSVEHTYRVHSLILGLHSPFFKASLSRRWAGDPEAASSSDPVLWRYELRFEEGRSDGICVRKVRAALTELSRLAEPGVTLGSHGTHSRIGRGKLRRGWASQNDWI